MNRHVAIFFIVFLLSKSINSYCQNNLVTNGSFEDTIACPWSNDLNNGQLELAKGWWKPTLGTSDFFHRCNDGIVSVPNNFWGHQEPFQGNGYVGCVVVNWHLITSIYTDFEYVETQLNKPLISCHKYRLTYYVSLAEVSKYAMSKLGALITKDEINQMNYSVINRSPQIVNQESFITDTTNWVKISGEFTAQGGEEFLTLGYFYNTVENDTMFIHETGAPNDYGYGAYYIDSVSLIDIGLDMNCDITFANTFSPNGDGINDYFSIENLKGFKDTYEVIVLNRWGEIISVLNKNNYLWDGTSNSGKNCPEGVYYFTYSFDLNNEQRFGSGYIHLFR